MNLLPASWGPADQLRLTGSHRGLIKDAVKKGHLLWRYASIGKVASSMTQKSNYSDVTQFAGAPSPKGFRQSMVV